MMRLAWSALLVVTLAIVTGCSTFRPAPPTGLMWAYMADSQTVSSLHIVAYFLDRPTCEVNRARDMKPAPSAVWAELKIPSECRQVAVGAGTDYWAFMVPGKGALGTSERDWCMKTREAMARTEGWLGACQPVAVKPIP